MVAENINQKITHIAGLASESTAQAKVSDEICGKISQLANAQLDLSVLFRGYYLGLRACTATKPLRSDHALYS
ncbi:hypothetical protein GCM10009085_42190 [Pseudomonas avellanae]|nr:hypothetical protein GCM10009085_42190 [Pseudomonas avellanae]